MRTEPVTLGLAAIALTGLVTAYWATSIVEDERLDAPTMEQIVQLDGHLLDQPAADFALTDLDGETHTLSSLRGNVVFLNFWATWCPPCRDEMPSMLALARSYSGRPFRMVAVTQDDDREALDTFLREAGFEGDDVLILHDPEGTIAHAWGTRLLPETYVINADGTEVARFMGARDWTSEPARRLFEHLMRPRT